MIDPEYHKWIVLMTIGMAIFALLKEWLRPSLTFFSAVLFLLLLGIVSPADFMLDFANQQIATIILLVVITAAIRKNLQTEKYLDRLFSSAKSPRAFLLQMSTFVASVSAFVNNTPLVAIMIPYVYSWCKRFGAHPSKLMIPLSYSAILGGMMTVIGTSTNLVLNGFLEKNNLPTLTFWDFFSIGAPITFLGIMYMYFVGYKLLPENKEAFDDAIAKAPEYLVETRVNANLAGKKLSETHFNKLKGIYLIEMHRSNQVISPIPPDEILQENDALLFMGKPELVIDLVNSGIGLRLPIRKGDAEIAEAVVVAGSDLAGRTAKEFDFEKKFDAELIAIHRKGQKVNSQLAETRLFAGDLLLLSVQANFIKNMEGIRDLYVISTLKSHQSTEKNRKNSFLLIVLALVIGIVIFNLMPLFVGLLLILGIMLICNFFTFKDVSEKVDIDLVLMLVCALTLGHSMTSSGLAQSFANQMVSFFGIFGNMGYTFGLFVMTLFLTAFITNAAAVSISFPIAFSLSQQLQIDGTPFYMAIVFAASGDFMTPIGYQTNLMVYGAGSYKPIDFLKVGTPMTFIYSIICLLFIYLKYWF